jgi:hypothetical protein
MGIGAAVAFVALGIAAMAYSFSLLDAGQILAMAAALLAIAYASTSLSASLLAVATAGKVASYGLGIVAGFLLAIGASVALAGAGIMMMGEGIRTMFDAVDPAKMVQLQTFLGILMSASGPLALASGGFVSMGFGLGSMAIGLGLINAEKLQSLAEFAQGIAQVDVGGLDQLARALGLVAEAMDSIPITKAIALTATMTATAITAKAVEALGGTGAGVGAAGSGKRFGTQPQERAGKSQPFEVKFILDGDVFERKVIDIHRTENERWHASAARGEE